MSLCLTAMDKLDSISVLSGMPDCFALPDIKVISLLLVGCLRLRVGISKINNPEDKSES